MKEYNVSGCQGMDLSFRKELEEGFSEDINAANRLLFHYKILHLAVNCDFSTDFREVG
jgi:hypothetical protein